MADRIFDRLDKNDDGQLSREEFGLVLHWLREQRGEVRERIRDRVQEKFDKNGDGKLDDQEREAARQAWRERRGQGGQ
jgi:Ca2+-binding EF-hand superfamily protein